MGDAEAKARAEFFAFELGPVESDFAGDWQAFYDDKLAKEKLAAAAWSPAPRPGGYTVPSAQVARGHRMLRLEFETVIQHTQEDARKEAERILREILATKLQGIANDCVFYSKVPNRAELCLARLEKTRATLGKDGPLFHLTGQPQVTLSPASPETGMVAQASVAFGSPVDKANANDTKDGPAHYEIELWWSGPVMPEANGPVFSAPETGTPSAGRWRFYDLILPYSRAETFHQ